jgi:hypothetical protein
LNGGPVTGTSFGPRAASCGLVHVVVVLRRAPRAWPLLRRAPSEEGPQRRKDLRGRRRHRVDPGLGGGLAGHARAVGKHAARGVEAVAVHGAGGQAPDVRGHGGKQALRQVGRGLQLRLRRLLSVPRLPAARPLCPLRSRLPPVGLDALAEAVEKRRDQRRQILVCSRRRGRGRGRGRGAVGTNTGRVVRQRRLERR